MLSKYFHRLSVCTQVYYNDYVGKITNTNTQFYKTCIDAQRVQYVYNMQNRNAIIYP